MVNGLHAESVNEVELSAFINSNLSDQGPQPFEIKSHSSQAAPFADID
jgi:hypothetical protein